jgi:hypothetical protein
MQWAETQNGLGTALAILGEMTGSAKVVHDAIQAFELALSVYVTHDLAKYRIGTLQNLEQAKILIHRLGDEN